MTPQIKSRSKQELVMRIVAYKCYSYYFALFLLVGCGEFEQYKVLKSDTGLYATVAIPITKDSRTICIHNLPVEKCSRADAIFYGYRGRSGNALWIESNTLLITQVGGEIRKKPPKLPIEITGQTVKVELEYKP